VDEIINNIVKQAEPLLKEKGERAFSPLMGEVMKVLRGKVDGKILSSKLQAAIKKILSKENQEEKR
jgi:glutamyl-tRNA(Gln) amidotransferase subunit E